LFPWLLVDEISRWTCAGTDSGIFEDDQVTHVEGDVDPVRDMEIIHEELRLKDLEYLDRTVDHMERVVVRGGDKSRKAEYVITNRLISCFLLQPCLVSSIVYLDCCCFDFVFTALTFLVR